jgi:hypothetical protein
MKPTKLFVKGAVLVLIYFFLNQCAFSQPGTTTEIKVIVDTDRIGEDSIMNLVQLQNGDDPPSKPGTDLSAFLTEIEPGSEVVWKGVSKNGNDVVKVWKVSRKGTWPFYRGRKLLESNGRSIPQNNDNRKLKMRAQNIYKEGEHVYHINFAVFKDGEFPGKFKIDPKIRMRKMSISGS